MDIISVNFETGAVAGSIDKFWDEVHNVREEKAMQKSSVDRDAFVAAVRTGKSVGELAKQFNVSWPTAKSYIKKYCTDAIEQAIEQAVEERIAEVEEEIINGTGGDETPVGIASVVDDSDPECPAALERFGINDANDQQATDKEEPQEISLLDARERAISLIEDVECLLELLDSKRLTGNIKTVLNAEVARRQGQIDAIDAVVEAVMAQTMVRI